MVPRPAVIASFATMLLGVAYFPSSLLWALTFGGVSTFCSPNRLPFVNLRVRILIFRSSTISKRPYLDLPDFTIRQLHSFVCRFPISRFASPTPD